MTRAFVRIALGVVAVGLVVGLILTGIQKLRAAAAQAQCANHAKQIGIALHNYHSALDRFPPGTMPNATLLPEQRLSWMFAIIPYVESTPIYRATNHEEAWDSVHNRPNIQFWMKSFVCPLQGEPGTFLSSYPGVAGVGPDAATLPSGDPRAGVFGYDRHTALPDITDGPANTLVALESRTAGPWAQGGPATVRGLDPAARPHLGAGRPFETFHPDGFGLAGPRTFSSTGVFADGSVRVFRESVDPEVLEGLATIAGKEPAPPSE